MEAGWCLGMRLHYDQYKFQVKNNIHKPEICELHTLNCSNYQYINGVLKIHYSMPSETWWSCPWGEWVFYLLRSLLLSRWCLAGWLRWLLLRPLSRSSWLRCSRPRERLGGWDDETHVWRIILQSTEIKHSSLFWKRVERDVRFSRLNTSLIKEGLGCV